MSNPRKPRNLKVLQGTTRPSRDSGVLPDFPVAGNAPAPDWLVGADSVAEWNRLVGLLTASRILTAADLTAMGHLCNLHGACLAMYRANLAPTAAQLTQLRLYLAEFGLTPVAREKVKTTGSTSKNPFAQLGGQAAG